MKKITRLILIFSLLLSIHSISLAEPVSLDKARTVACNWLAQQTGKRTQLSLAEDPSANPNRQSASPAYYIFKQPSEGWVIISGDDVAYPVIGYSTHGHPDPQNQPPAFIEWMNQVAEQINSAVLQNRQQLRSTDPVTIKIQAAWTKLTNANKPSAINNIRTAPEGIRSSVPPLLKTTWSQGQYYNAKCPYDTDGPGNHVLVGCVATAMGQIMKYHEWPLTGTGSNTYNCGYGSLYVDFGSTMYGWDAMPDTGSLSYYNTAVSTLLYHAGVAVDMNYGVGGSSASPTAIAPALRNYFKYEALDYKPRSAYSTSEWLNLLVADLNTSRPILYGGQGTGGHAFVCDGYSGTDYFHFNWGWNGCCDGYYYLDDLTPGSKNYNYDQGGVFGIYPKIVAPTDLLPYHPVHWNYAVPISKTKLSGTDDHYEYGPYYDNENLYFNIAYLNNGNTIANNFTTKLEITGQGGSTRSFYQSSLQSNYYSYRIYDVQVGLLTPGTHTIKMWVDYYNDVPETDETNNYYERTITVYSQYHLPSKIIPILPNGVTINNTPTYAWNALHDETIIGYRIYVDDSSGNRLDKDLSFSDITHDYINDRIFITPDTTLKMGDVVWWVCAKNDNGYGQWSDSLSFTIINPASYTTAIRNVPTDYNNIQAAIDASIDGDIVLLADGVFTGPGNLNIDFKSKQITVKSKNGFENCIIDCQQNGRGFLFCTGETDKSKLDGVTIKNGVTGEVYPDDGGGIYIYRAFPSINNCKLDSNTAGGYGGGVYSVQSLKPEGISQFNNCIFSNNYANSGGAADCYESDFINCSFHNNHASSLGGAICSPSLCEDCIFDSNTSLYIGGAVYFSGFFGSGLNSFIRCKFINNFANSDGGAVNFGKGMFTANLNANFTNCVFSNNQAAYGGAIYSWAYLTSDEDFVTITNCSFGYNVSTGYGGALYLRNENSFPDNIISINNCILWGNQALHSPEIYETEKSVIVSFSDIRGGHSGVGNIDANPLFLSIDTTGDLYLNLDSPCIDSGTSARAPADDIEGYLRPIGLGYDMGAYEYSYNIFSWVGGFNSDWKNINNWDCKALPDSTDIVVINTPYTSENPEIFSDDATAGVITISSGTLTISQGKLTIGSSN